MSQHDLNIANQGFPAFRSDLNDALVALGTNASGATEPSTTFAHQFWMDTAADPSILKVRNADNDAWITLGTFNQTADTFTPSGVTSDKIEEGNSKVEVVDTGTGYIVFEVDGAEVARFNPDQLVTKAGTASTPAISPTGDLNTGIFFPAADTIAFAEGGAEAMRIDSSGRVLMGTTSHIDLETGLGVANATSAEAVVTFRNSRNISGDVCLKLFVGSNCNNTSSYLVRGTVFGVAPVFFVFGNGNVQNTNNSYGGISDVKLKQDIVDAGSQWDDIKNLRVRKFRFNNDPTGPLQIGVVAQEIEEVSPGLIDESPDFEEVEVTDQEGNVTKQRNDLGTVTKSVKYSVLYMKAVKALQEAMERIETLEAKVQALENSA